MNKIPWWHGDLTKFSFALHAFPPRHKATLDNRAKPVRCKKRVRKRTKDQLSPCISVPTGTRHKRPYLPPGHGPGLRTHQHLESILQRHHIRVIVLLQLERMRDNFDGPGTARRSIAHLVADPEVTGVFRHAAESVHGALRIGLAVGG